MTRIWRAPEGEVQEQWLRSLARAFLRQLSWLVFGVPTPHRYGRWVWNSRDRIWRLYVDEVENR